MPRSKKALSAILGVMLFASGCGFRTPATPIAPGVLPPAPPPNLSGNIGGQPFVARSAIMLHPTHWVGGGTQQVLRIYEREMDCARADDMYWGDGGISGERFVEVTIGGAWPMYPNSVWRAQLGQGLSKDGSGVDIAFVTVRGGGGGSGSAMSGEMRVLQASRGAGVVSVQASRTMDDPFMRRVAPKDVDMNSLGSLGGNIAFLVCEGGRGG